MRALIALGVLAVLFAAAGPEAGGPAAAAQDAARPGTGGRMPPDAGVTGEAPHAETGLGKPHNVDYAPARSAGEASPSSHGEAPPQPGEAATDAADRHGNRPFGDRLGATEEVNQGPQEQRLGEKPAP